MPNNEENVTSDDPTFKFTCISTETNSYEATGTMAPKLPYMIKYTKIRPQQLYPKSEVKVKEKGKKPAKVIKYSSVLHFYDKALVKRICCDQLDPLQLHKERGVGHPDRRNMVLRKIHQLGGWIRSGKHKDRTYVAAGTKLPKNLLPRSQQKQSAESTKDIELDFF